MSITLKEAIIQAFDFLDKNYDTKWSIKASTRSKLIEAFSQTEVTPSQYLGYKRGDGLHHAMQRAILSNYNKSPKIEWRNWLLSLIDLFLCRNCNTIINSTLKAKNNGNLCKVCDSNLAKKRTIGCREQLYKYLLNHPCVDCGIANPIVLEFDHLEPNKKEYNISSMMGYSWANVEKEISKCEVVCANCHRIRTAKQFNWYSFSN